MSTKWKKMPVDNLWSLCFEIDGILFKLSWFHNKNDYGREIQLVTTVDKGDYVGNLDAFKAVTSTVIEKEIFFDTKKSASLIVKWKDRAVYQRMSSA